MKFLEYARIYIYKQLRPPTIGSRKLHPTKKSNVEFKKCSICLREEKSRNQSREK
jgi:hypothetical protein